jgi:hypothetical protein
MTPGRDDLQRKASETVQRAGIDGERGVAVHEGFATRGALSFDDTVGMTIPGASLLVGGSRRIILVTDRNVHLFQGRRFDKPRSRLGCYPLTSTVMSFDGERVALPDGQVVYLTAFQARSLAIAAPGSINSRELPRSCSSGLAFRVSVR